MHVLDEVLAQVLAHGEAPGEDGQSGPEMRHRLSSEEVLETKRAARELG
jgi:hypothetical protein